MNGEHNLPPGLAEKVEQAKQENAIAAKANAAPLPGPLAEAFSPCQNIVVKAEGKTFTVRPFYELDFEVLMMCKHPLANMALGGDKFGEKMQDLRGEPAWVACWLLTTDLDEVEAVAEQGEKAVKKAAKKFGRMQLGGVLQISSAVIEQFSRYFATVVQLESGSEDGEAPKKG